MINLQILRPILSLNKNAFIRNINSQNLSKICSNKRLFHSTAINKDIFNIQDEKDFEDRVIKSELPVIVDFHAQ